MERRDFLEMIGAGAAFALTATCLGACNRQQVNPIIPPPSNLTLDLTLAANSALQTNGGYVIVNNIIVARTLAGGYAAASAICTHQGGQIGYAGQSNIWYCNVHGAQYNLTTGAGLNSFGANGLHIYTTSLSGNILTIS